jgi:hypothetical protein
MACMPSLLDVDQQPSQLVSMQEDLKRKETEGLEGTPRGVHGLVEQVSGWGTLVEDGIGFGTLSMQDMEVPQDSCRPTEISSDPTRSNGLVFGPHSPRAQPGQDDGPVVENASDSENIEEAGPGNAMDLLSSFLVQHSRPIERALLPVPTRSQEGIEPVL